MTNGAGKRRLPDGMWRRGRVYYARFRKSGKQIRKRLSTDFQAAKEMLNALRARADRAEFDLLDNHFSWDVAKAEFLQWARQSVRDWKKYSSDLDLFEEFAKPSYLSDIDHPLVIAFREWRLAQSVGKSQKKTVSPRTINRQVATLKNMLNKAVEWRRIGSNPIASLVPLPHDSPRKQRRSLSVEEISAFLEKSPDYLRPVWLTFMTTGLRRSELVELRFGDVDFKKRSIIVRAENAKNRREREVPLDDTTFDLISQLKRNAEKRQPQVGATTTQTEQQQVNFSTEHVFVGRANTPLRNNLLARFYAICKRAGISDGRSGGQIDIHALRVSFITLAIEFGGNPRAIQAIVGHQSLDMTMRVYAKATDRSKREAISVLPFASISLDADSRLGSSEHAMSTNGDSAPQVLGT